MSLKGLAGECQLMYIVVEEGRMWKFSAAVLCLSLFTISPLLAQQAPIPDQLMTAKSAFVVNDGVWFKVYDKFYGELVKWNRFRLVQRSEDADITIVLSHTPGTLVGGVAVPSGGVFIGGSESKYYMRITVAKDGTPLWADMTGEAGLVSNSGKRLVSNLQKRMVGRSPLDDGR
jgi:hypothetical protein